MITQTQHTTVVCWRGGLNKYQPPAADCLQRPVRHSSSCSIPIVDGKDSEEILGSAAYLNSKERGDRSLPAKPRAERRRWNRGSARPAWHGES